MKEKAMLERQDSGSSSATRRIGCYLLPVQVALLMLSGLFVMQMLKSTPFEYGAEQRSLSSSSPSTTRRLRHAQDSYLDHQKKSVVIEDLRKLYEGTKLEKDYVHEILKDGQQLLSQIDTIYDVPLPTIELEENPEASKKGITIVGDIHGDFFNLIHLFKVNGFPSLDRPYIFNGDYTDRGEQSLHCLLGLLLIKRYCNECIHLNTGNHETIYYYGTTLKNQTIEMYGIETYSLVRQVLLQLPLAAVVDERVFVIHGGIPSKDFELDDLRHYKRGRDMDENTKEGYLFRRSVWSDPDEEDDDSSSTEDSTDEDQTAKDEDDEDDDEEELTDEQKAKRAARIAKYANHSFEIDTENDDDRGWFTSDHTKAFLDKNHFEYVVRAHQGFSPGYNYQHDGKVITIHSFPKTAEQNGAYMNIYSNDKSMHIEQFAGLKFSSITHQSKVDWRAL